MKKLWVVGEVLNDSKNEWLMVGVFDSEELAIMNALKDNYFIGPVELNQSFPMEECDWDGAYYPSQKRKDEVKRLTRTGDY